MSKSIQNFQTEKNVKMNATFPSGTEKLYFNSHNVDVITESGAIECRNVIISINRTQQHLELKLRDQNDFSFNFSSIIDWNVFDRMKSEQYLEISFEEFHLQFLDLLKQTLTKDMLLRLEHSNTSCKMVFYERSKIKSLIFLIVDLTLNDQKDIIEEMAKNIKILKETNNCTNSQLQRLRNELKEKDILLNTASETHQHLERQIKKDLKMIEQNFIENVLKIKENILNKVNDLSKRCDLLFRDVNVVKNDYKYKEHIYSQTMFQLEQFKRDNEKNYKVIDSLRSDMDVLNCQKMQNEKIAVDLRQNILRKDKEIEKLNEQINDLRKDIHEATIIIAQRTNTHDEIAKDLVQANTMLVNFNKQYDVKSKEVDHLRDIITAKNEAFEEQSLQMKRLSDEFDKYKKDFNVDDLDALQHDLRKCRERIDELEKHNREAVKINGLLTKKLAAGDVFDTRNMHWSHPK